jgi:hypothetical protein
MGYQQIDDRLCIGGIDLEVGSDPRRGDDGDLVYVFERLQPRFAVGGGIEVARLVGRSGASAIGIAACSRTKDSGHIKVSTTILAEGTRGMPHNIGRLRGVLELHRRRSAVNFFELDEASEGSSWQNERTTVGGPEKASGGGWNALN